MGIFVPEHGETADFEVDLRQEERLALLVLLLHFLQLLELARDVSRTALLVRLGLLRLLRHALHFEAAVAVPLADVELARELDTTTTIHECDSQLSHGRATWLTYDQCRVVLGMTHEILQQ